MLDNQDAVSSCYQGIEGLQQLVDIMEVKTCCGLVEDKKRRLLFLLSDKVGQFYTLVLTTRKCR